MNTAFLKKPEYRVFGLLLLLCITFRIWFWNETGLTYEDALITFRYSENISSGHGFVYNANERVQGTTTPAWTLILAGAKYLGADLFIASKILGVLLDTATLVLTILILYRLSLQLATICALFFAVSPVIIPVSISGMETSLLICMMSVLLLGYVRKNILFGIGVALTLLTRVDGIIYILVFTVAGVLRDKKWALRQLFVAFLCIAPWYIFSLIYFGNILPQSVIAKRAVYNLSVYTSSESFIFSFTPFLDTELFKIFVKSGLFVLLLTGIILLFKNKSILFPIGIFFLLYCAIFMLSRAYIFSWYLIPPTFFSYFLIAIAVEWIIEKAQRVISTVRIQTYFVSTVMILIFLLQALYLGEKVKKSRDYQEFENGTRRPLGLWLKEHAKPGSKVFLEPLGYIGYFAGRDLIVWDEVGLVNPKVSEYRKSDPGWYTQSIKTLNPDYVVQYADALEKNLAEGTQRPLFKNDSEKSWFFSHFQIIHTVNTTDQFPSVKQREKNLIVFKKVEAIL